ncbi:hypothetical protein RGR602_PC01781 (plasmid) [Rhizobium gallicum bv. gallicum R602sp]|uniref:Uncharacterized protein n=1 Tax=Rhizobium gallicum bv. gallicum R602sp TaxID=1041138 RepID=A0A0B4XGC8_9HYPH|nr:hypothetical protein RGR602_PC01781 [Rhizobium gallicum bv. gallicum R602sp]
MQGKNSASEQSGVFGHQHDPIEMAHGVSLRTQALACARMVRENRFLGCCIG